MGVWIETYLYPFGYALRIVTPFVGVWIETKYLTQHSDFPRVTPFVGVWIETLMVVNRILRLLVSHPSWVCGLKLIINRCNFMLYCHTLRGCVD